MSKIIPTLFALSQKEFNLGLKNLSFSKTIHIDYMDGKFTENKSVSFKDMSELENVENIELEVHIMGYEPLQYISYFKKYKLKTIYVHFEAFEVDSEMQYEIFELKNRGFKVGIALNPNTPIDDISYYFDMIDSIMLMSVWPGQQGQKFISSVHQKIKELKQKGFNGEITVDGGINETNIKEIFKSGATKCFIGSYINSSKNPKESYEKLLSLIKK